MARYSDLQRQADIARFKKSHYYRANRLLLESKDPKAFAKAVLMRLLRRTLIFILMALFLVLTAPMISDAFTAGNQALHAVGDYLASDSANDGLSAGEIVLAWLIGGTVGTILCIPLAACVKYLLNND